MTNWVIESVNTPSSMYWMRGPAGVGKPTIAQTRAEELAENDYLGAAFFFTVKEHRNPLRLFTTIAYQLTTTLPDYHGAVEDRIFKDNTIVEKKMSSQLKSLIVEPLQELRKQGKSIQPKAIFIDGLDECVGEDARAEIIKIITSSIREGSTPFHWAIFRNLALCRHSSRTTLLQSLISLNSLSLARQTARSRCICGANSRTNLNTEVSRNCSNYGQLTTI